MHLNNKDNELFYKMQSKLLGYVNEKYNFGLEINGLESLREISPANIVKMRDKLWEHKESIGEYVEKNADTLTKREIAILKSWESNSIIGTFAIMKNLGRFSVFMTLDEHPKLYGVIGITDPIGEKIPSSIGTCKYILFSQLLSLPY